MTDRRRSRGFKPAGVAAIGSLTGEWQTARQMQAMTGLGLSTIHNVMDGLERAGVAESRMCDSTIYRRKEWRIRWQRSRRGRGWTRPCATTGSPPTTSGWRPR